MGTPARFVSALRAVSDRPDLIALAVLAAAVPFLPGGVPGGIYGVGLVAGAALALQAVGLVLVYRANRIINLAQVQIGVVAAVLFRLMVEHRVLLHGLRRICEPCVERETATLLALGYWLSLALAFGVSVGISWLIYAGVVRRFARAPRLVLTVVTVGVAQLLGSIQEVLPGLFATEQQRELNQISRGAAAPPPVDVAIGWRPAIFRTPEILTVAVAAAALCGLIWSVRRSRSGTAIRAAAENPDRAATLGIDVGRLTGRVWLIAGALSGAAGLLAAMSTASPPPGALSASVLVRILAVAVIAGMSSIPVAVAAAAAIGVFDQAMLWSVQSSSPADGVLAAVILLVLLLQRSRASRAEQELVGTWRAAQEVRPVPALLRAHPSVRAWTRAGAVLLAVSVLGAPFALSPTQTGVLTITLTYGMVGISLLILSGWAGQISLGQFGLAAVGGVVTTFAGAGAHLPVPIALLGGAIAGGALATLVGVPALRVRGLHLAITTLAIAVATSALLLDPEMLGRHLPEQLARPVFVGLDLADRRTFYYAALAVLVLVIGAAAGLRRSRIGRALIAARDNEVAAQAYGVNLVRARLTAFAISGAIAALAGGIFAYHEGGVQAADFTPERSIAMFLMVVIGGLGSIAGPLAGAAFLGTLQVLGVGPLVLFLATGGGVVLLLMLVPGGLAGLAYDVRDALLRRFARRHGIAAPSLLGETGDAARAPISPAPGPAGTAAFVPERYRVRDQWGMEPSARQGSGR